MIKIIRILSRIKCPLIVLFALFLVACDRNTPPQKVAKVAEEKMAVDTPKTIPIDESGPEGVKEESQEEEMEAYFFAHGEEWTIVLDRLKGMKYSAEFSSEGDTHSGELTIDSYEGSQTDVKATIYKGKFGNETVTLRVEATSKKDKKNRTSVTIGERLYRGIGWFNEPQ